MITSRHVTGEWVHIVDDGMVDEDAFPDEARPTGHVVFEPVWPDVAIAGDAAYTLTPVTALIADGQLRDVQGREGVWLAGQVGEFTVRWQAVTTLLWQGETIPYPSLTFDLEADARLTALLQSSEPGGLPWVVDPRVEGLIADAMVVLADAQGAVEGLEQLEADAAAHAQAASEDRTQTGLDRVATGEDRTATGEDRTQTGLDREQTRLDRVATGQDRTQTGLDRVAAAESASAAETAANEFGLTVTSSQVGPEVPSTATLSGDGPAYAIHLDLSQGEQGRQGDPGEVTTATLNAALAGKADLTGGQVPTSQLPAIALTKPFPVADRAAMLALTAQEGDVAVITAGADKGTYMLGSGASGTFASWVKLTVPDAPVQSVNGQTGTVNLGASDVGASPTGHKHAVPADLITTGTPLSTTFLNGVGAWATPPDTDTTYAVMAEAEAATGTATTARAVSAAGLKGAIQRWATGSYATAISAIGQALNKAATAADARTAIGAGTSNLALGTTASTARAGNWVPTKSDVGLGSVDNTSDAAKPVSTLQQAAINAKVTNAGGASGMWIGTTATLPPTGTTGVLYVTY